MSPGFNKNISLILSSEIVGISDFTAILPIEYWLPSTIEYVIAKSLVAYEYNPFEKATLTSLKPLDL